ncbi:MAG TPA: hypothetical protein VFN05_03460 [Actinomycetes bacterium]|nr:hypothetical protein [Actinomycetes bacterium]
MWSWDITKLPGPTRHEFYDLYVILDIYSRYAPGWLVGPGESAELAEAFIAATIAGVGVAPGCSTPTVSMWRPVLLGFLTHTAMDARGCWCRDAPRLPDPHADRQAACVVFPRIRRWPGSTRRGACLVDGVT